jgi:hypothetical protein
VSAPWPCSQCGAAGFRNVYARGYCATHLAELYACFDVDVWDGQGVGVLDVGHRPDHGPEFYDLRCVVCGATWVGPLLAPCTWCSDVLARNLIWQAELTLTPPDVDPDDATYDARMAAWAERLRRAIEAGIVTTAEADDAINRLERSA